MHPLLLHIESATDICSIAVSQGQEIIGFTETQEAFQHASKMTLLIEAAVRESGYGLKDLDGVSVSQGPGSYTSLRVGFSTAKGICYALDKPMMVVGTLEALAGAMKGEMVSQHLEAGNQPVEDGVEGNMLFLPMIDARRMEVYTGLYDSKLDVVEEPHAVIIEEDSFEEYLNDGRALVLGGNGAPKCKTMLNHAQIRYLDILCSARHLVPLACVLFSQKQFVDVAYVEPFYLKPPNITVSKKKLL